MSDCLNSGSDVAKIVCAIQSQQSPPDWLSLVGALVSVAVSTTALLFVFFSEKRERRLGREQRHDERFNAALADFIQVINTRAGALRSYQAKYDIWAAAVGPVTAAVESPPVHLVPEKPSDVEMWGVLEVVMLAGDTTERTVLNRASSAIVAAQSINGYSHPANLIAIVGLLRLWRTGEIDTRKTLSDLRGLAIAAFEEIGANDIVADLRSQPEDKI